MIEFLLSPIDPERAHEVAFAVSWHGRFMVFAWGVLLPLGILAARFFKVMPGQDWPREIQNPFWFLWHRILQYSGLAFTCAALLLILTVDGENNSRGHALHQWFGWSVIALAAVQYAAVLMRGSGGGPLEKDRDGNPVGDHFTMRWRRIVFEYVHKNIGYAAVLMALCSIFSGLWLANAPVWMWLGQAALWLALICVFVFLQRQGRAVDTYQAIWGTDPSHPGNQRPPIGWGIRRGPPFAFAKTVNIKKTRAEAKGKRFKQR